MRLSDQPRAAGLMIGVTLGVASWIGNASRTNLGLISAFPDLLTPAAVPLLLYFFVRARVRATTPPGLRAVRRAGWTAVNAAATVLAIFLASVAGFWFNQWDLATLTSIVVGALVVTVAVGYISVEVWARLLLRAQRQEAHRSDDSRRRGDH